MARVALVAMFVVFAVVAGGTSALPAQCVVGKLVVCAPAIISGAAPTEQCCTSLKAQEGCLCIYGRDPAYRRYINSPNARKTITSCGIPLPECAPEEAVAPAVGA